MRAESISDNHSMIAHNASSGVGNSLLALDIEEMVVVMVMVSTMVHGWILKKDKTMISNAEDDSLSADNSSSFLISDFNKMSVCRIRVWLDT